MPVKHSLEWLNEQMHRSYPQVDDCLPVSTSGEMLPSTFQVDLALNVHMPSVPNASSNFFISEIDRADTIQIILSYRNSDGNSYECAKAVGIPTTQSSGDTVESRTFQIIPLSGIPAELAELSSLSGQLIIGSCVDIVFHGSMKFTYDSARILSTLVTSYTGTGLERLLIKDKDGILLDTITSDFVLKEGDGIKFTVTTDTAGMKTITISRTATAAEKAQTYKSIEDVVTAIKSLLGNPIYFINAVQPDSNGAVSIQGGDCTAVTAVTDSGIQINNSCSKPCCSSEDMETATSYLNSLEDAKQRLINYYESLSNNINIIQSRQASLIASRK